MSESWPHLLSENVPRYTSYPTAPHFSGTIGAQAYASWLRELRPEAALSLYLHVPFCAEICLYCGCHTKASRRREPIDAYAGRLIEEVRLLAAEAGRRRIVRIHWGGGTPSMLGEESLKAIHAAIADDFDLTLQEHAIELDPRHVTSALAQALAAIGIDRVSLGVQDFNASVQRAIGRIQPFETVLRAGLALRVAGIEQLNCDLMYGLPGQTVEDVRRTAMLAHALSPSRMSVFGYAHVPWMKSQQRLIDQAALPGAADRLAQANAVHDLLIELGYQPIGLDHYARAGDELAIAARQGRCRRNFQGYTADGAEALIGLGASAIGRLPQGYVQNASDVGGYSRAIADRRFATVRGIALSPEDRLRGGIIERLMCDMAVDLDAASEEAGTTVADRFAAELKDLAPLARTGLVAVEGRRIAVSEKGRRYLRLVAATFDAYLSKNQARHSVAV
jgi:oxygen-independent coproporphyrinogen-3 oxidase